MKPNYNLKCQVFKTPFTCESENFLRGRWHFSNANQSKENKQSGNNADAVLNDFTNLESQSAKIMFDEIFLWIVPMMKF